MRGRPCLALGPRLVDALPAARSPEAQVDGDTHGLVPADGSRFEKAVAPRSRGEPQGLGALTE